MTRESSAVEVDRALTGACVVAVLERLKAPLLDIGAVVLRLVTYNIRDGGIGREQRIVDVLAAIHPDVIVLQEVTHPAFVEHCAAQLGMHGFFARGNTKRHLALLSQRPVLVADSYHPFPPIRASLLEATIATKPTHAVQVFGVHLVPQPGTFFEWWRTWELRAVLRRMHRASEQPCLLVGDFNAVAPHDRIDTAASPWFFKAMLWVQHGRVFDTAIRTVLAAGFIDCYRTLHPHADGFTLPTPTPRMRVDYAFANPMLAARLRACDVMADLEAAHIASDHYPLLVEFDL